MNALNWSPLILALCVNKFLSRHWPKSVLKKREQNVYFTLYRGLCFHDASFEMQTVGWRAGMGGGKREDESFVVLGFNELENTIALFWLWKLLWGHHKLAAGRWLNWRGFVWSLRIALSVSGGAFWETRPKRRSGIQALSVRTVKCFSSLLGPLLFVKAFRQGICIL